LLASKIFLILRCHLVHPPSSHAVKWALCVLSIDRMNEIRYSIPEEMKKGSVIGNVAQDLGLDLKRLSSGRARIVTGENVHYTELQKDKGILVVNERIDREQLCGDITPCSLNNPKCDVHIYRRQVLRG
uniref:Cadherin N-terminal domain-containing protein n=1 Tax=Pundamilia nyererei TaxID=303518 RepID=A0A3B4GN01_9CICH